MVSQRNVEQEIYQFDLSNFEIKHVVRDVEFKMGQMVCWEISVVVGNNGPQFDWMISIWLALLSPILLGGNHLQIEVV